VAVSSRAQQKTLLHTIEGSYTKEIPIDFWPTGLNSIDNNLVFINVMGMRKESNYYNLSIVPINEMKVKKRLLFKQNEKNIEKNKKLIRQDFNNSYTLRDTLCYWEKDYDTVWRITNKLKAIPQYVIHLDNKMPFIEQTGKMPEYFKKLRKTNYNCTTGLTESTRFFFISANINHRLHRIIYDKKTKKSVCPQFKREFRKGLNLSFYNDIDGGFYFWPQGLVADNKVYKLIYGYELKEYLDRKKNSTPVLDEEARKRLIKLAEKSELSDNPILMIVTLKQ